MKSMVSFDIHLHSKVGLTFLTLLVFTKRPTGMTCAGRLPS